MCKWDLLQYYSYGIVHRLNFTLYEYVIVISFTQILEVQSLSVSSITITHLSLIHLMP